MNTTTHPAKTGLPVPPNEARSFRSAYAPRIGNGSGNVRLPGNACHSTDGRLCTACHASAVEYAEEIAPKESALREFWKSNVPGDISLQPLVRSPLGRRYRAVSKRKVVLSRHGFVLALMSPDEEGKATPLQVADCLIEPEAHGAIFRRISESLSGQSDSRLLDALNYVVIKGNLREHAVILNVRSISGPVVKLANALSRSLTRSVDAVKSVFLFQGEGDDRYYLGSKRAGAPPVVRRLFGPEQSYEQVRGKSFLFDPLAFSQVNPSILDALVGTVEQALKPGANETLFDLYCGYGLFAVCLAGSSQRVLGAEWTHASVFDAKKNAERNGVRNARFVRTDIDGTTVGRILDQSRQSDVAVLDPPRNGTAPGTIEVLASKRLRKVVHLFCNIDLLPSELSRWSHAGYALEHAVPFDMFPGTDSVEIMTVLSPRTSPIRPEFLKRKIENRVR